MALPLTPLPPRPRVRTMLAPLPLGVVVAVGAMLAGVRLPAWLPANEAAMYGAYLLMLAGVGWACREAGVTLRDFVGRPAAGERTWSHAALALATFSMMLAAAPIMMNLLAWLAPELLREYADRREVLTPHTMVVAVLIAPAVEELVFRGVVLRSLAARWGTRTAVVASALLFGVMHVGAFGAVFFGIVMALLYLRTRTLLVPILCHAIHNGLVVLSGTLAQGRAPAVDVDAARSDVWLGVLGLAGAVAIFIALVRRVRPEGEWVVPELTADR